MIKIILFGLLSTICFAEWDCHYEAVVNEEDCPNMHLTDGTGMYDEHFYQDSGGFFWITDYDMVEDGDHMVHNCPLDPNDALEIYLNGTIDKNQSYCEADAKYFMDEYRHEYPSSDVFTDEFNATDWDTRPEGTVDDLDNCNQFLDIYEVVCIEIVHCVGEWGDCDPSMWCTEEYSVITPASNGGDECPHGANDIRDCPDTTPCDVDCTGSWGACSNDASCEQEYTVATAKEWNGADCPAATGEKQYCEDDSLCPVDCVSAWSPCSNDAACVETFAIYDDPVNGGAACEAANGATRACADDSGCPATTEAEATTAAPSTPVGGEDCKALDEAGCAAQPDSCRATSRSGKFRKCKPKRCKPMTESECEAAVHCEKKFGRRGDYKRCRRIDSSRA